MYAHMASLLSVPNLFGANLEAKGKAHPGMENPPLPETPKLPSVPTFAVGKISGTRQTWCLPSVPKTTLGKDTTRGITAYAEC